MNNSDIQHKVADWQRRLGYPTKNTLLKFQQNIDQFPLSENQIRKYYTQFPWFTMGRMTRSTFHEKDDKIQKNSRIGDIVATDAIPIKSYGSKYDSVHLFIDQKSKFCTIIFGLKNDGAKELATYTIRVKKQYEIYGHNLKKLQTDSLSAYQTTTFENILLHNNIIRRESSPLEHQQNGLVERLVRSMEENISSMRAAAPWVPKKYITFQILLWVQLWNLQEGSMKNISRTEEFKNKRPTLNNNSIPGAWGDCFLIHTPKDLRTEKFDPHTRGPVMYMGPNLQTKDAHYFLDAINSKILTRRSFQRIPSIPKEWKNIDINSKGETSDTVHGSDDEYYLWHRGATEKAIELTSEVERCPSIIPQSPLITPECSSITLSEEIIQDNNNLSKSAEIQQNKKNYENRKRKNNEINNTETEQTESAGSKICTLFSKKYNMSDKIFNISLPMSSPSGHLMYTHKVCDLSPNINGNNDSEIQEIQKIITKSDLTESLQIHKNNEIFDIPQNAMIHLCDEEGLYGLKFDKIPTKMERENVIKSIRKISNKYNKNKKKSKKKGKQHSDLTDNPNLSQALKSQYADDWTKAINAELQQMKTENVYTAVTHVPHGKPWVPSQMILIRQRYADGKIKKYKARLVAGGHRQNPTFYTDTSSSPTARPATIKLLFAKAAIEKKIIRTFDVKGAYLKSDINEEIYMLLPLKNKNEKSQYVKLNKSIYGLRQAGLLWFQNIKSKLLQLGAIQCPDDECLFHYEFEGDIIDIVIYVDDLLTASSTQKISEKFIIFLRDKYGEVNEVTNTSTHLGIYWRQKNDKSIHISQPGYVDKIIKELKMENETPTNTPISPSQLKRINEINNNNILDFNNISNKISGGDNEYEDNIDKIMTMEDGSDIQNKLRQIIGLLNHFAIHTQPDIMYSVSYLATRITSANENDIEIGKHIVRYIKGTRNIGLTFSSQAELILYGYADASYLTHNDAKSHSGICYSIGKNTACFYFKSNKQRLTTRSSAEAELIALDLCVVDIIWFRNMLEFLGAKQSQPTIIYEDNQSAMLLAAGKTKQRESSKHLKMRYHYVQEAIASSTVVLVYIKTNDQPADILTKHIASVKDFCKLRSIIMNLT